MQTSSTTTKRVVAWVAAVVALGLAGVACSSDGEKIDMDSPVDSITGDTMVTDG